MNSLENYKRENLRACQLRQLHILEEIDKVCKKNKIEYWLDKGTLLGAYRHGGFIPWDDGLDIGMKQDQLKKFLKAAPKELPSHLFVQTWENEPIRDKITRVRDNNSIYLEKNDNLTRNYNKGIYVSIFAFEEYPSANRHFTRKTVQGIYKTHAALTEAHRYDIKDCMRPVWLAMKFIHYKLLWKLAYIFNPPRSHYGALPTTNSYGVKHRSDETWPLGTITFEGKSFPAPKNVRNYLKEIYRNYEELPEEKDRKSKSIFIEIIK